MIIPLNKPGRALLIDLINATNERTFTDADLQFNDPLVLYSPSPRNTQVDVTGRGTSTFNGPVLVQYNRIDLNDLLGLKNMTFNDTGAFERTLDLLPMINTRFGLGLDETDIEDEALALDGSHPAFVTLYAKASSYAFVGSIQVKLTVSTGGYIYDTAIPPDFEDETHHLKMDSTDPNLSFVLYSDDPLYMAIRPSAYRTGEHDKLVVDSTDAHGHYQMTLRPLDGNVDPSDAPLPAYEVYDWQFNIAMQHPDLKQYALDERIVFSLTYGGQEFRGLITWDEGQETYVAHLGDPDNDAAKDVNAWYVSDDQTQFQFGLTMDSTVFPITSPEIEGDDMLIGDSTAALLLLDEDKSTTLKSVECSVTIIGVEPNQGEVAGLGNRGFVVAAQSRTFLADNFAFSQTVEDVGAPTGFPLMINGANGEVFAFKVDFDSETSTDITTLRYSLDRGLTWQETLFVGYDVSICAVFFLGQVYARVRMSDWPGIRICRLAMADGAWMWEYVLDLPYGCASMVTNGTLLTCADEGRKLYHTADGVEWEIEDFSTVQFNGQARFTARPNLRYLADGQLVGQVLLESSTGDRPMVLVVRNGPGDWTVKTPDYYGTGDGITETPDWYFGYLYLGGGSNNCSFNVGNRWFITLDRNTSGGAKDKRGDLFYSDDLGDTWHQVLDDPGIQGGQFAYDGERILYSGTKWRSSDGSAGWAGMSSDLGLTWDLDDDAASAFGETRNQIYVAAARTESEDEYPTPVAVPALSPVELFDEPAAGIAHSYEGYGVTALSFDGFALFGNYKVDDGAARDGLLVFGSDGTLSSFDAQLTPGAYFNTGIVNAVVDLPTDDQLLIAGNFTEVGGVSRSGLARVDRSTGANISGFADPVFINDDGDPALLQRLAVDSLGKIYVCGQFVSVDGHDTAGIARLNSDGTVDTSFVSTLPHLRGTYYLDFLCAVILDDDRLLVGVNGAESAYSADHPRVFEASGAQDATFLVDGNSTVHVAIREDNGGVTLFGSNLGWDGSARVSGIQLYYTGSSWVRDTSFVVTPSVNEISEAVRLSTGVYAVFDVNGTRFLDGHGATIAGYKNLKDSGSGTSAGALMAVNSLDEILIAGQFEGLIQSEFPRLHGVKRDGVARYKPIGAQNNVTGGDEGPNELSGTAGWNPDDKSDNIELSNYNLTATHVDSTTEHGVRLSSSKSSGKWCLPIHIDTLTVNGIDLGLATDAADLENYLGHDAYGWSLDSFSGTYYHAGAGSSYATPFVTGDIVEILYDADAGEMRIVINGVAVDSGNPIVTGLVGPLFAAMSFKGDGDAATIGNVMSAYSITNEYKLWTP